MALLDIENLTVGFGSVAGPLSVVDDFSLSVEAAEIVAIVGESGSGKSLAMRAVLGNLPVSARANARQLRFDGVDLLTASPQHRRSIIGKDLAVIMQDPISALNPSFTVGFQIEEVLKVHLGLRSDRRRNRAAELLDAVGITDAGRRLDAYPHQLSGGMCQRVMIAIAIACRPKLLIADEPTTALDVTIQAQIFDLLKELRRDTGMAIILITHDLGVVAETAERVVVQYAGKQMEVAKADDFFSDPHHPYSYALLSALPELASGRYLPTIGGAVPLPGKSGPGCTFAPRCRFVRQICRSEPAPRAPALLGHALCHTPLRSGAPVSLELIP